MKTAVAYLRVSTKGQGGSGLGVEAQRAAVEAYCRSNDHRLIDEFVEVESGRITMRPGLQAAILRAKGTQSLLVIARLDRLSRSSRFIGELLESELRFVACDVPSANRLILHILAAVAEEEARAASIRTKAALAAAKARGVVLGNPGNLPANAYLEGARASAMARRRKGDATIATVGNRITYLRGEGWGYHAIASALNEEHYKTAFGKKWSGKLVWRVYRRLRPTSWIHGNP